MLHRRPKMCALRRLGSLAAMAGLAAVLAGCSGSSTVATGGTGTIHVSLTDPPSCAFPHGQFEHVYVTIRSVQAHINGAAGDNSFGWQELTPQLNSNPMQIDLFAAGPNSCLLAMLGSNAALPAGNYQQLRLLLVPNDGGGGPLPAPNRCAGHGFNCAELHDGSIHELLLSSQANTGLKIPPGQIVGGPISVDSGEVVDLNIDFNACASIVQQGNGEYRLKPALTAGQVSTSDTSISGQVVDATTQQPIVGGTVLVALEQQDGTGADVILQQTAADSSGRFRFCPLSTGMTFDVVAVAINGAGVAYNATVAAGVPSGTNLGTIPLNAETGSATGPATLQGFVTAKTNSSAATIDASVFALQTISLGGGVTRPVTIPARSSSTPNISVESDASCPPDPPASANCAQYTLIEPASNPRVGIFSAGSISYSLPSPGDVLYSVRADAHVPLSGGVSTCTPSSKTTSLDANGDPLKANPSATVTPAEIDFSGCS